MLASHVQKSSRCCQAMPKHQNFFGSTLFLSRSARIACIDFYQQPYFCTYPFSFLYCYPCDLFHFPTTCKASAYNTSQQLGAQPRDSKCAAPSTNQRHPLHPVRPTRGPESQYGELKPERQTRNKAMIGKRGGRPLPIDASLSNQRSHFQSSQPNINRR
jgi:hypothetical protein